MSTTDLNVKMNQPEEKKSKNVMLKVLTITGMILGLLVLLGLIAGVVYERKYLKSSVMSEITQTWASQQTVTGPVLAVPYEEKVVSMNKNGKQIQFVKKTAYVLPEKLKVNATINPETRSRGIYETVVYTSDLSANGHFDLKELKKLNIPEQQILWKEAYVLIGLTDTKGLSNQPTYSWNKKPVELLPGTKNTPFIHTGLSAPVVLSQNHKTIPFDLALNLKGSNALKIEPVGKENTIDFNSSWDSPSFIGYTLPENRNITEEGFSSHWEIPYFGRNYGQLLTGSEKNVGSASVGVELYMPTDFYQQSERAVKYGILFLVLTFATYFLFEVLTKEKLHPLQYLLIGFSLCLFYLLLIALSEVIGFGMAYLAAASSVILLISGYSKAILGKVKKYAEYLIAAFLGVLYGYLYILLQLEDYSLLFGTLGLLVVLASFMYVTRNINWYGEA